MRPSGSGACPSMRLELLGNNIALGMMARLLSIVALLSPLEELLDLGKDSFGWPHLMRPNMALFVVDDAAKQAMRKVASWIRKGVQTALARMGNAITMVTHLELRLVI